MVVTDRDEQIELEAWAESVRAEAPRLGPRLWVACYGRPKVWSVREMDVDGIWRVPEIPIKGWQMEQLGEMASGDRLLIAWRPSQMNRVTSWAGVTFALSLLWEVESATVAEDERYVGNRRLAGIVRGRLLARYRDLGSDHLADATIEALRISANQVPRIMGLGPIPISLMEAT